MQVYKGKNYFILPKVALNSLNKYMDNERIWQWQKTYIIGKTNVILDSLKAGDIVGDICTGFYKIRKKTSFRLLYFIPPQKQDMSYYLICIMKKQIDFMLKILVII